jgi:putative flippase GtrA
MVFRHRAVVDRRREFIGFFGVGLAGLVLTQLLMALWVERLGLTPGLAKIPTAGLVFVFNFTVRRALLFSAPARRDGEALKAFVERRGRWLALLAAFCVFALSRAYQGVRHDGRLYVADALAKLDPGGIGRDLMFVHDGQFGFSLYTPLLSRLIGGDRPVARLAGGGGPDPVPVVRGAGVAGRQAGRRSAAGCALGGAGLRRRPAGLLRPAERHQLRRALHRAARLGRGGRHGGHGGLSGQPEDSWRSASTPWPWRSIRSWACAAWRRSIWPCAWRTVAGSRWAWPAARRCCSRPILKLPVADRLLVVMDPEWRGLVEARSPILFTAHWPLQTWTRLAVQLATLAVGATLLSGRVAIPGCSAPSRPASSASPWSPCWAMACRCCWCCRCRPGACLSRWPCWPSAPWPWPSSTCPSADRGGCIPGGAGLRLAVHRPRSDRLRRRGRRPGGYWSLDGRMHVEQAGSDLQGGAGADRRRADRLSHRARGGSGRRLGRLAARLAVQPGAWCGTAARRA